MAERRLDAGRPILDALARRWSPRAWADRDVEPEKIAVCLEAARWAASSRNQQPWHFIGATRGETESHARLAACLNDHNAAWAGRAPVLMVSVAQAATTADGRANRYAFHDTGLATGALMAQATALGLHVHAMGGFSRTKARELLSIPDGYDPVAALAIGYLGDPGSLPEDLRTAETAPRERRPLGEWVFAGAWGRSWFAG